MREDRSQKGTGTTRVLPPVPWTSRLLFEFISNDYFRVALAAEYLFWRANPDLVLATATSSTPASRSTRTDVEQIAATISRQVVDKKVEIGTCIHVLFLSALQIEPDENPFGYQRITGEPIDAHSSP